MTAETNETTQPDSSPDSDRESHADAVASSPSSLCSSNLLWSDSDENDDDNSNDFNSTDEIAYPPINLEHIDDIASTAHQNNGKCIQKKTVTVRICAM